MNKINPKNITANSASKTALRIAHKIKVSTAKAAQLIALKLHSPRVPLINWRIGMWCMVPLADLGEDVKHTVREISGRPEVPHGEHVPRDLRDHEPQYMSTRNGFSAASYITSEDIKGVATSPAEVLLMYAAVILTYLAFGFLSTIGKITIAQAIGCAGLVLILYGALRSFVALHWRSGVASFLSGMFLCGVGFGSVLFAALPIPPTAIKYVQVGLFAIFACLPYFVVVMRERKRDVLLKNQANTHRGDDMVVTQEIADLRTAQVNKAVADASRGESFIALGESIGAFKGVISPWVADAKLMLGYSSADTKTHTIFVGKSGIGKSSLIRSVLYQFEHHRMPLKPGVAEMLASKRLPHRKIGMFVLDFKAALPRELRRLLFVIEPANVFNAWHGRDAFTIAAAITSKNHISADKNKYFSDNGAMALFSTLVILEHINRRFHSPTINETIKISYNPGGAMRLINVLADKATRMNIINYFKDIFSDDEVANADFALARAFDFWGNKIENGNEEQSASFVSTATTWLNEFTMTNDKNLLLWAETENAPDFLIEETLTKGARIGVAVGDQQGAAGVLYMFIFARVFKQAAKQMNGISSADGLRSDCIFVIDEAASMLRFGGEDGLGDDQFASTCRSFGVHFMIAFQNISQLVAKSSAPQAKALLALFNTILTYQPNDEETFQYFQNLMSDAPRLENRHTGMSVPDYVATQNNLAKSPMYDENNPRSAVMGAMHGLGGLSTKFKEDKKPWLGYERFDKALGGPRDVKPILSRKLFAQYITAPNVALAVINRAGGMRYDFIKPYAVDEAGRPYDAARFKELEEAEMVESFTIDDLVHEENA